MVYFGIGYDMRRYAVCNTASVGHGRESQVTNLRQITSEENNKILQVHILVCCWIPFPSSFWKPQFSNQQFSTSLDFFFRDRWWFGVKRPRSPSTNGPFFWRLRTRVEGSEWGEVIRNNPEIHTKMIKWHQISSHQWKQKDIFAWFRSKLLSEWA